MSLLPLCDFLGYSRPSRLSDQHFGLILDPEDFVTPLVQPQRELARLLGAGGYNRPWRLSAADRDSGSVVSYDKDRFQVNLDVQQFRPEEITVKVTGDDTVTIEGKHEEKQDEHGYISRHFVRKYVLPKGHDIGKIESKLSSDGVLTICAPKVDAADAGHRTIPIVATGQPMKAVDVKEKNKDEQQDVKKAAIKK